MVANQWYYMNGDEKHGPFSDGQLKELARGGQLQKDDRIWKEGMSEWRTAGAVKGLFQQANPTTPPPLPTKPVVSESGEEDEENRDALASFGGSAKLAGQLASKQAEHTKIQQVLLPALHLSIGQQVFDTEFQAANHKSLFDEIKRLNEQISELEAAGGSSAEAKTIAEKAKALGNQTVIAGKIKASQFQRRQKLIALGKAIYETGEVPPTCSEEQLEAQRLLDRSGKLQSEIDLLKTEASAVGSSLMASTAVVASFAFLCAPIGLFLIWRHPTWSREAKMKWAAASVGCFLLFAVIGKSTSNTSDNGGAENTASSFDGDWPVYFVLSEEEKRQGWSGPSTRPAPPVKQADYERLKTGMQLPDVMDILGGDSHKSIFLQSRHTDRRGSWNLSSVSTHVYRAEDDSLVILKFKSDEYRGGTFLYEKSRQ